MKIVGFILLATFALACWIAVETYFLLKGMDS